MDIVIITASPRSASQSTTVRIVDDFCTGVVRAGASVLRYALCDRAQWGAAKKAFLEGDCILFALPLYNGMVPGTMMEFLQMLSLEQSSQQATSKKIAYILQSGFPEGCQRRCCEAYLRVFTQRLNCRFAGVLSHGNTFNIRFSGAPEVSPTYEQLGCQFVQADYSFHFREAELFSSPEHITPEEARIFNRIFRFFCERTAEAQGCTTPLDHRPYHIEEM